MKLLKKRGNYLREAKFAKSKAVETQINTYKNEHYSTIVSPVYAFIIFEHEQAQKVALKNHFRQAFSFNGYKIELQPV